MTADDLVARVLRVRAVNAVNHTRSLAAAEPAWQSSVHPIAGGWLVLAGAGMYLNQAMAAGITVPLTGGDIALVRDRSRALGVAASVEVAASTDPASLSLLDVSGFEPDRGSDISCLTQRLDAHATTIETPEQVVIRPADSIDKLRLWQQTSVLGWQHASPAARRASDSFAAAAYATEGEHLVIAHDAVDDRPIGCAATTIHAGVAMLGGMSTVPAERRRGVQSALINHRLKHAARVGCDLALSTAATRSASARNLERHGFTPRTTITRYVLPLA